MKNSKTGVLEQWPFHILAISIYPILALYAFNVSQVQAGVIVRPVIISIALGLILLLIIRIFTKDWLKAGAETFFLLLLFFTYGQLYNFLKGVIIGSVTLGRHRFMMIVYGMVLIFGSWLILRRKNFTAFTRWLNIFSFVLLIFPIVQILNFSFNSTKVIDTGAKIFKNEIPLTVQTGKDHPDIYYIILDTYTREDALKNNFNYDNSGFTDELTALGFYVADCSRSNYGYTQASLVSSLNLNYLPALFSELKDAGLSSGNIWTLIKQSQVRQNLEAIGYRTVALQTGFAFTELTDADVYISLGSSIMGAAYITKFESMLLRDTAVSIILDSKIKVLSNNVTDDINFPFTSHVVLERFKLSELPKLPSIQGPKFVFVHILMPHVPIVFGPNGEVLTDPGYYSGEKDTPINDDYSQRGYSGEIQFLNSRMIEIVKTIINESSTPPIIIIQGDHGLKGDNHYEILNVYYFPDGGEGGLYPKITPVNSFRVLFNTYFGTDYQLLPDQSFAEDGTVVPETSPSCVVK